jgi:hypothetical protein
MVEDDHRPLLRRQPAEAAFELVPRGDGDRRVGIESLVDRDEAYMGGPATVAPRLRIAGVDDEPTEPGVEPFGLLESRQVPPGAE